MKWRKLHCQHSWEAQEYEHLFPDIPSRTDKIYHDVDIIDGSKPVKQYPHRMNPVKQQYLSEEVQYLLDNDFIEPSQSEWKVKR